MTTPIILTPPPTSDCKNAAAVMINGHKRHGLRNIGNKST